MQFKTTPNNLITRNEAGEAVVYNSKGKPLKFKRSICDMLFMMNEEQIDEFIIYNL